MNGMEGSTTPGCALLPTDRYGLLNRLPLEVHRLASSGQCEEALAAARAYEPVVRALGDELSVNFLIQGRMHAHVELRQATEAIAAGQALLARHRATGNLLGEAKILSDLTSAYILGGRVAEGIRCLARSGLILEGTSRRNDRYVSALGSYADAARIAELYETAAVALAQLTEHDAIHAPGQGSYHEQIYMTLLLIWGLRLDQLGHTVEATSRLRRAYAIATHWLSSHGRSDTGGESDEFVAAQSLALAKIGEVDQAIALAETVVMPLRDTGRYWWAAIAHLAGGIALGTRGDFSAARRELLAAQHLCTQVGTLVDQLIVQYELGTLAVRAHGLEACGDLFDLARSQADLLWQQRLQRLAMLHQARQREELEAERAGAQAALLRDPLTGISNRRHFDHLMAALDDDTLPLPVGLLVIDVDRFKDINDTHSHSAGDTVLRELGAILNAQCRIGQDTAIRYAGDEFTVFLNSDLPDTIAVAERIRRAIADTSFDHIAPGALVSVSIGAAALQPGMTATELFHAADANLYNAKREGRDRVAG